jgi:hypothetical protein
MGASVSAYWPGISEDQIESQPGFFNDCKAWGNWMANREEHTDVIEAMKRLSVGALCTVKTDGVDDADVEWATPSELERAAMRLRELVLAGHPDTKRILEIYAKSANAVDPIDEEFARDLEDVAELARFAAQEGASRMTLEVNW